MIRRCAGILVLATLMLMAGATPAPAQNSKLPSYPIRWLAAGDSYSSGQGLEAVAEPSCQRAFYTSQFPSKAWAVIAKDHLQDPRNPSNGGKALQIKPDANGQKGFDFVACGGSVTEDLFDNEGGKKQWDKNHNGRFDLVTLSIGGNNIGFPDAMKQCAGVDAIISNAALGGVGGAAVGGPAVGGITGLLTGITSLAATATAWTTPAQCPPEEELRQKVNDLGQSGNRIGSRALSGYRDFLAEVAARVVEPGGHIVVVGYPEMFEDPEMWNAAAQATDVCQMVRRKDAAMLRGVAGLLNQTIGHAVELVNDRRPNNVNLSFIDVNTGNDQFGFANQNLYEPNEGPRHNLCAGDSKQQWLNGVTSRLKGNGSFHPTQTGHDRTGALVAEHIRTLEWPVSPANRSTSSWNGEEGLSDLIDKVVADKSRELNGVPYEQARQVTRGDLDGDGVEDAILLYTVEGMDGGNGFVQILAVFRNGEVGWSLLVQEVVGGKGNRHIALNAINRGVIEVETEEFTASDPLCCPSLRGNARFRLSGRRLVEL